MNLLVAEDDAVTRLFLIEVLTDAGHAVHTASDGERAISAARTQTFDRLLLDLNLPRCRGDAVLERIRGDPNGCNATTPAIALTADTCSATRDRLIAAGFAAVLAKPMGSDALLRALIGPNLPLTQGDNAPAPPTDRWDDQQALRTAGGSLAIVAALRSLLLRDLPDQCTDIVSAVEHGQHAQAMSELHKLRAACGFCGAPRLGRLAAALEQALQETKRPADILLTDFRRACDELLETRPAR